MTKKVASDGGANNNNILDKCSTTLNLLKDKVIRIVLLTGRAATKSSVDDKSDNEDDNIDAPLSQMLNQVDEAMKNSKLFSMT